MRQLFDVLARQRDAQTFGDEGHEGRFQLGVLKNPRRKARRLARVAKPVAKTRMGLFGHADKEHRFQFAETYSTLPGQTMLRWQDYEGSVPDDAFPPQVPMGRRRAQAHKAQINFPRFQSAKLFRRGHVEEVERDVWESLAEGP